MATRMILKNGDPQLRKHCHEVKDFNPRLHMLLDDMRQTLAESNGVGLAAPQVGVLKRLFVMDCVKDKATAPAPMVMLNPEVTWTSEETNVYEEGCLSIPEYYEEVERPAEVKVRYMDLDGKTQEIAADGLLATCLQHEIDHLNGVLFIDHLSRLKRERVTKKFAKSAKRERAA